MEHGRRTEPHRPGTKQICGRIKNTEQCVHVWFFLPVTSSPKTHVLTTRQSQERHDSYQMRSGGRGVQRTEYGDEVKRLEPISEVNSLVDQEEPEFNLVRTIYLYCSIVSVREKCCFRHHFSEHVQDGAPHIGGSGMDWLENLSQNTGNTLSKIDWAAVERMVAAVED